MSTTTRSHRDADCRYCQRYGTACGRHTETVPADPIARGYELARESYGASYADYLIEHDAELAAKGIELTPWPLSLAGNDGL